MDIKQVSDTLNTLIDMLENTTETRRTRKSKSSEKVKSEKFKYPNHDETIWYEHKQYIAEHRFDCSELREMENKDAALNMLISAITDQLVIFDQNKGRALTADGFTKKYGNGEVIIDVKDACSKQTKGTVSVDKLTKQAAKLPSAQQKALADDLLKQLGFSSIEAFEASQQKAS